jgi:hypothetical protein
MTGIFILLGGMAAFIGIITTLDLIARRHDDDKRSAEKSSARR